MFVNLRLSEPTDQETTCLIIHHISIVQSLLKNYGSSHMGMHTLAQAHGADVRTLERCHNEAKSSFGSQENNF